MLRTTVHLSLVVLLSLALASCDAMFSNNIFSKLAQKEITRDSIAKMSTAEVIALTSSAYAMQQLAADPEAKAEALSKLEAAYGPAPTSSEGQAAAIAAATIDIETVPDAAKLSASAISVVATLDFSSEAPSSPGEVVEAISSILPDDLSSQLASSETPPPEFTKMFEAFTSAYGAYSALSAGLDASGGSYADPSPSDDKKMGAAVDAVISGLFSAVQSTSPGVSPAQALWSALRDPAKAGSLLSFGDLSSIVGKGSAISGVVKAAGLEL